MGVKYKLYRGQVFSLSTPREDKLLTQRQNSARRYTFHMQQCSLEDESVASNTKQILEGETHRFKEGPLFKCNTAIHD